MDRRDDGREPYLCAYVTPRKHGPEVGPRRPGAPAVAEAAGVHDSVVLRKHGPAAAHGQREARPQSAARAGPSDTGPGARDTRRRATQRRRLSAASGVRLFTSRTPGFTTVFSPWAATPSSPCRSWRERRERDSGWFPKQVLQHPTVAELALAAERPDSPRPAIGAAGPARRH
jgi:hypothetical protein